MAGSRNGFVPRVPYSCASGLEAEPHSYKRTNRESRAPKDPYDPRRIRGNANQIFPKQRTTQKEAQKIHASWTLQLTWRWRLRRTAHTARNWRTLCARRAFTRALLVAEETGRRVEGGRRHCSRVARRQVQRVNPTWAVSFFVAKYNPLEP